MTINTQTTNTLCKVTKNYWVSGLFQSSGILGDGKHDVLETGSVSQTSCFLFFRMPDTGKSPKTQ
jgi:hypothetical protein